MITRPTPGPHICLRCQRSLAKRTKPSGAHVAFQSTGLNIRRVGVWRESKTEPQNRFLPEKRGLRRSKEPAEVEDYIPGQAPKKLADHGLGRLYGHKGNLIAENQAYLPSTALGKPAKAIVLKESIFTLYDFGPKGLDEELIQPIDILRRLEDERGLVGWEEVEDNINACRPNNEEVSTWDHINGLVQRLQEGFTLSQLAKYIVSFEGKREPESPLEEWVPSEKEARILKITPWMPGISEIGEFFDNDPLRGYYLQSHTAKQRLILRLLRECWMLELPELEEGIGQFEIQIRRRDLDVLLGRVVSPFHILKLMCQ